MFSHRIKTWLAPSTEPTTPWPDHIARLVKEGQTKHQQAAAKLFPKFLLALERAARTGKFYVWSASLRVKKVHDELQKMLLQHGFYATEVEVRSWGKKSRVLVNFYPSDTNSRPAHALGIIFRSVINQKVLRKHQKTIELATKAVPVFLQSLAKAAKEGRLYQCSQSYSPAVCRTIREQMIDLYKFSPEQIGVTRDYQRIKFMHRVKFMFAQQHIT